MTETLYTEVTGGTVILAGQRGTLTGLQTQRRIGTVDGIDTVAAFVRLDGPVDADGRYLAPGPMLYVTLGAKVAHCTCLVVGDSPHRSWCPSSTGRTVYQEVTGWRVIDRDEFDRINELDVLRADMGWK